jgi:hypothetical protein
MFFSVVEHGAGSCAAIGGRDLASAIRGYRNATTQHLYAVHPTNLQLFFESAGAKLEFTKQRLLLRFLSILMATGASSPPYHNHNPKLEPRPNRLYWHIDLLQCLPSPDWVCNTYTYNNFYSWASRHIREGWGRGYGRFWRGERGYCILRRWLYIYVYKRVGFCTERRGRGRGRKREGKEAMETFRRERGRVPDICYVIGIVEKA